MFSPLTKRLIDALCGLPGIGPRSAQRMAFYLLRATYHEKGLTLSETLAESIEKVGECENCRTFSEEALCDLCTNPKRDQTLWCVVENPADAAAIEQTQSYRGLYFVLHGHLSPLDGIGPNDIGIPQLLNQIELKDCRELIIATNPTIEGRATAHYIATLLNRTKVKCSRIAHGVPFGGELEFLDGSTLSHAMQSRLPLYE